MILEYIEGFPKEPGWYFMNYGNNQVKAVLVHGVEREDGVHLYANIDIVALPVDQMNVNAWAGPVLLRTITFEQPEEQGEQPEAPAVEPELVEGGE